MKRISCRLFLLGVIALAVLPSMVKAQMPEEDKAQFDSSIKWLESNLAYVYENKSTGVWWNNNFFYSPSEQQINIKNASSDVPNATDKNVYFDRIVKLNELDIASLRVENMRTDKGRIVKGKVLHIDAIGKQKRIQKLYNQKPSFKEFFLQISFPESNDSLIAKAEECKEHFETILRLSAKVYPTQDSLVNTNYLFDLIPGTYEGSDKSICVIEELFPHSLELKFSRNGKLYKKSVISYDESNHHFIYWMVNVAGSSHFELNFSFDTTLNLEANAQNYRLTFPSSNLFSIEDEGVSVAYSRTDF
ncbi:MAG: hypothetical protein ABJF11_02320 [Reichenbachiella sp.]|uniref:hypothetical protein n=1 Tax=Reichenbachiella sp. TaxID=2184521 RepID=UPI003264E9B6